MNTGYLMGAIVLIIVTDLASYGKGLKVDVLADELTGVATGLVMGAPWRVLPMISRPFRGTVAG
jgi:hypothetical protein